MSEITKALEARQAQIIQLQSDIETLRRAAGIVGRKGTTAKVTSKLEVSEPPVAPSYRLTIQPRSHGNASVGWCTKRSIPIVRVSPAPGASRTLKYGASIEIVRSPTVTLGQWCSP